MHALTQKWMAFVAWIAAWWDSLKRERDLLYYLRAKMYPGRAGEHPNLLTIGGRKAVITSLHVEMKQDKNWNQPEVAVEEGGRVTVDYVFVKMN